MSGQLIIQSTGGEMLNPILAGLTSMLAAEGTTKDPALLEEKFAALLDQGLLDSALAELSSPDEHDQQLTSLAGTGLIEALLAASQQAETSAPPVDAALGEGEKVSSRLKHTVLNQAQVTSTSLDHDQVEVLADPTPGQQPVKRQETGVASMLKDLPTGWETLLQDKQSSGDKTESTDQLTLEPKSDHSKNIETQVKPAETKPTPVPTLAFSDSENSDHMQFKPSSSEKQSIIEHKKMSHELQTSTDTFADEMVLHQAIKTSSMTSPLRGSASSSMHLLHSMNDVQKQSVIKSFTQDSIKGLKGREDRLQIELNPPELGRVQVLVHRAGEQIHAKIIMADSQLGEFFQEHLNHIRKSIEASGMKLGDFSLEVGGQHNSRQEEVDDRDQGTQASLSSMSEGKNSSTKSRSRARLSSTAKVDMMI